MSRERPVFKPIVCLSLPDSCTHHHGSSAWAKQLIISPREPFLFRNGYLPVPFIIPLLLACFLVVIPLLLIHRLYSFIQNFRVLLSLLLHIAFLVRYHKDRLTAIPFSEMKQYMESLNSFGRMQTFELLRDIAYSYSILC